MFSLTLVLGLGHVAECIQLILWLLPLKLWECLFLTGRHAFREEFNLCFASNPFLYFLLCIYFFPSKSSSTPAEDPLKLDECRLAGKYLLELLKMDLKPRDIITPKSLHNAMVIVMALGGSTNAVLHLIAIAR